MVYGVGYWHVVHQVPGLRRCPQHGLPLSGSCADCGQSRRTLNDLALPGPVCSCQADGGSALADDWSDWLCEVFSQLVENGDGCLEWTQNVIRTHLGLPTQLDVKNREVADRALTRVERRVGLSLLSQLFKFYGTADGKFRTNARPNLVLLTLKATRDYYIRHPLHHLALLWGSGVSPDAVSAHPRCSDAPTANC